MAPKNHARQYDLVVFGATGYTGRYTARHITKALPTNLKWAVAGRSREKLQDVVDEIRSLNPDRIQPGIEICNLNDADLTALAQKTYVLLNTVGPFARYGEHAVKACAETGTHYLDATGEVPWVLKMIKKYESAAASSKAIIVPQIGIESAPSDLMTWILASMARKSFSCGIGQTIIASEMNAMPSGGTLETALTEADIFTSAEMISAHRPYALSPIPNPTRKPERPLLTRLTGVLTVPNLGILTTNIQAAADAAIVERSWGLMSTIPSREDQSYGPRFTYQQYTKVSNVVQGFFTHLLVFVIRFIIFSPIRKVVRRFLYRPGEGPSLEASKKHYVTYTGIAVPDNDSVQSTLFCKLPFKGSMYECTGIFLAQAAMTILEDDLDLPGGFYTPSCLGQGFVDRLAPVGVRFETAILDG